MVLVLTLMVLNCFQDLVVGSQWLESQDFFLLSHEPLVMSAVERKVPPDEGTKAEKSSLLVVVPDLVVIRNWCSSSW